MNAQPRLTISSSAFTRNIDSITRLTGVPVALVVKANAYGHGAEQLAQLADRHEGITWLCTAGISEALQLRDAGITKPLLVLYYQDGDLEEAVRRGIHVTVSTHDDVHALATAALKIGATASIHVQIDTGFGGTGVPLAQARTFLQTVADMPGITLYGISTHAAVSGKADTRFTAQQFAAFDELLDELDHAGITIPCVHAQSSSSLTYKPLRSYSFVRVGGLAYGLWKSDEHKQVMAHHDQEFAVEPIARVSVPIIQLKQLPVGHSVGYERKFTTSRPTTVAILPIGYWHGYAQTLSCTGQVVIGSTICPIVGVIGMNFCMVDVTDVSVNVGDQALVLGECEGIQPYQVAQRAHRIAYDITTSLHPEITREVVFSQAAPTEYVHTRPIYQDSAPY